MAPLWYITIGPLPAAATDAQLAAAAAALGIAPDALYQEQLDGWQALQLEHGRGSSAMPAPAAAPAGAPADSHAPAALLRRLPAVPAALGDLFFERQLLQRTLEGAAGMPAERVAAVVEPAWERFFRLYSRAYVADYAAAQQLARRIAAQHETWAEQLAALGRLEQLLGGDGVSSGISAELEALRAALPVRDVSEDDLRALLRTDMQPHGIALGAPTQRQQQLDVLLARMEKELTKRIRRLQQAGTRRLLSQSGSDTLQKLLSLLSLSRLQEITTLLAGEAGDHIVAELAQLLPPAKGSRG